MIEKIISLCFAAHNDSLVKYRRERSSSPLTYASDTQ